VKYFNFIVAILLSILYATGKIPPTEGFNLWITSFIIPLALALNHVLLVISLFLKKKSSVYYVIALLIGSPYLTRTIGIKHLLKSNPPPGNRFSVVSYNMGGYSMRPYHFKNVDSARAALKNWIVEPGGDILCYQEFVNVSWSDEFNLVKKLSDSGTPFYFSREEASDYEKGTLIISKFPIVSSGDVLASTNGFNRIAYVDLKINDDTVRIINVHLESMGLRQFRPHRTDGLETVKTQMVNILRKLKIGVFERSKQINQLADFIEASPYPVVCAGDFNDLPYSYNYHALKKIMKNSFEETGRGMGFTYNGGTIKLLRIDNQFFSSELRNVSFATLDSIRLSDHFPLRGEYQFLRSRSHSEEQ